MHTPHLARRGCDGAVAERSLQHLDAVEQKRGAVRRGQLLRGNAARGALLLRVAARRPAGAAQHATERCREDRALRALR